MTLHIGIDGSRIAKPVYTGTEHYSYQILQHIFRVAPHHRYTIYAPKKSSLPLDTGNAWVDWRIIPFPRLWTQFRLSWEMLTKPKPDILFIPSHTIPIIHPRKVVTTVHDLGFKIFPDYYDKIERLYQSFGLWQAVRNSTRIIAVSGATKNDLIKFTSFNKNKIEVIYHGYDRELFKPAILNSPIPQDIKKFRPYLYFVSRLEVKKNVPNLIKAFAILKTNYQLPHYLILAGKRGSHGFELIEKTLHELPTKVKNYIVMPGYVSNQENASWLKFADALVFPSGFEGFGLPVLEAMACGIPVVVSNSSSLPEVVSDAGIMVNHTSALAIAEGVMKLIHSKKLRSKLIVAGLERAKIFSWEKAALQTIGVIEAAAKD